MIVVLLLIVLAVVGAPLFLVISGAALAGFASIGRPAADVTGEISKLVQMDTLITIPLFTFAGYLLAESGAPRRMVDVIRSLFGWLPGGMAIVTLVACAFFTTFTGASGITIVALGGLLLPVLLKEGYPRDFSLGLVTTSGSRGLVFPPSLPVIIYGYVAAIDITKLYQAGIVPGLIAASVITILCFKAGIASHVPRTPFNLKAAGRALLVALPEVLLPVWLIALILTAVLKVPEAAAMTALYVLIVEVLIYRDVHPLRDLPRITKESMVLCGAILIILGASLGSANYLVDRRIPQQIVAFISGAISSKWVFLLALNGFLLIVGCMLDIFSAIVVVVPLITPLAAQFGIHPMHLAIIFLLNLELGYNTPPVGMNLFIGAFRFRQPVMRLYKSVLPFLLLSLAALALITYVEPLSTFTVEPGQSHVQGGMIKAPTGGSGAPTSQPGAPRDGICDPKKPGDPDCDSKLDDIDDIDKELDKELDEELGGGKKKKKKKGDARGDDPDGAPEP